jgi:hypothetical protein
MLDRYDPRWGDEARDRDEGSREIRRGSRCGSSDGREREPTSARDVFTRDLSLPRGQEREIVHGRDRTYQLRGSESRALATVGAFRVANASNLRDHDGRTADPRRGDLRHLREEGLLQVVRIEGHRDPAVVLTNRGKELLESHRLDRAQQPRQAFYAGLRKPRELEHDSQLYAAYLRAAERVEDRGGRVERVVLDYEIKRDYQRFLQDRNRNRSDADGRPDREAHEIAAWARQHELPYFDEQVHIPDVRIEYEDVDGRMRHLDIEVETPHYRGAHAAAASRSGFACYHVSSARIGCGGRAGGGGRSGPDLRIIEELLR